MIELLISYGPVLAYFGIVFLLALTGAGLPIPEEVIVVAAGVLSSPAYEMLHPAGAFAACIVGALVGDTVMYGIGRFLGKRYLREHPRFARLLHGEREKKMEDLIQRHGLKVFFLARFLVGVRAPIYLAAGAMRVSWKRFLLVDAFCATTVVGIVFGLSYRFGEHIGAVITQYQRTFTVVVLAIVVVAVVVYFLRRKPPAPPAQDDQDGAATISAAAPTDEAEVRATRIVA